MQTKLEGLRTACHVNTCEISQLGDVGPVNGGCDSLPSSTSSDSRRPAIGPNLLATEMPAGEVKCADAPNPAVPNVSLTSRGRLAVPRSSFHREYPSRSAC